MDEATQQLARLDAARRRRRRRPCRVHVLPRQPRARQPPRRRRALRGHPDRRRRGMGRRPAPRAAARRASCSAATRRTPSDVLRVVPTGGGRAGRLRRGDRRRPRRDGRPDADRSSTRAMRNAALEWALASAPPAARRRRRSTPWPSSCPRSSLGSYGPDAPAGAHRRRAPSSKACCSPTASSPRPRRSGPVRIDELEIVEVYGQRAEEAGADRPRPRPLPPEAVRSGLDAALRRPASAWARAADRRRRRPTTRTGMWRRLIVSRARRRRRRRAGSR